MPSVGLSSGFYLVWAFVNLRQPGELMGRPVSFVHHDLESARQQALELATKYPGFEIFVLAPVGRAKTPEDPAWSQPDLATHGWVQIEDVCQAEPEA